MKGHEKFDKVPKCDKADQVTNSDLQWICGTDE